MGNISSQTSANISTNVNQYAEKWTYSFPRTQTNTQVYQHKVFPEGTVPLKLRATSNGEILQSGGTLTRRNQTNNNIRRSGSEPDLRLNSKSNEKDVIRSKKKYKAPSPPKQYMRHRSYEENANRNIQNNNRKPRLFKTRIESNRNSSSPLLKSTNKVHVDYKKFNEKPDFRKESESFNNPSSFVSGKLERCLSTQELPSFSSSLQEELKMATSNLKYLHMNGGCEDNIRNSKECDRGLKNDFEKEKLKTLDPSKNNFKKLRTALELEEKIKSESENQLTTNSSTAIEEKPNNVKQPKTFYFGMEEPIPYNIEPNFHYNHELISSFDSDLSSGHENECQISKCGIDLKLRPILPKKHLEIPRFSPAQAWRLLSALETTNLDTTNSVTASEDVPIFIEDQIEKFARPPPPTIQLARFSNDKSGDSGISGDAGPAGFDDNADILYNSNKIDISPHNRISWTPQQDLEDDSSMEEYLNNEDVTFKESKTLTKPHVFSLSLPRDNHIAAHMVEKNIHTFNKKIPPNDCGMLDKQSIHQEQSDNWLLSKSQTNSLNNCFDSMDMRCSQKSEDLKQLVPLMKQNSGRVMYLPELDVSYNSRRMSIHERSRYRSHSMERVKTDHQLSVYSRSCDNLLNETCLSDGPEDLQDSYNNNDKFECSSRKPKKFTFQSTIRQIERKLIADKLSKEAERKEKQRLRELEVMRRVEEEFQRKRDREKVAIRQQLRLYSMDDEVPWSSLPPNLELKEEARTEPDGAASPTSSSNQSPEKFNKVYQKNSRNSRYAKPKSNLPELKSKVLSEYKQPQRDYKEFRSPKYVDYTKQKTTVHPQVKCNMPKYKGYSHQDQNKRHKKEPNNGLRHNETNYSDDSQLIFDFNKYTKSGNITKF